MTDRIEIIFSGMVYIATLLGCYDGDTCTIRIHDNVPFSQVQKVRFGGFDTPEIRGKCAQEKELAQAARDITLAFMRERGKIRTEGRRDSFQRLIVTAPDLEGRLTRLGLARPYRKGKGKRSWCAPIS